MAFGADSVANQITAMPAGSRIELLLKDKQKMLGTTGPVSSAGFAFIDASKAEHQIAFDDVASVRQIRSHTRRNVLIGVAIGVAALGITAGLIARCAPFGCGTHTL